MISCIAELHGRSWADQTEHRYAFRSCSPTRRGRLPVRQGNKDTAGCLHPASVILSLSLCPPLCFDVLLYAAGASAETMCFATDWAGAVFPWKWHMFEPLSVRSFGIFFWYRHPLKEHGKRFSRREKKKKKKCSQTCLHNSPVLEETSVLSSLGKWRPSRLLQKREDLTDNPTSIEYRWMTGKKINNNLNRSLALSLHPRSSTDPALWLPGLTVLQRPSLELESAIIITGLFANSAVPNGSKLALYCSHSMDLA